MQDSRESPLLSEQQENEISTILSAAVKSLQGISNDECSIKFTPLRGDPVICRLIELYWECVNEKKIALLYTPASIYSEYWASFDLDNFNPEAFNYPEFMAKYYSDSGIVFAGKLVGLPLDKTLENVQEIIFLINSLNSSICVFPISDGIYLINAIYGNILTDDPFVIQYKLISAAYTSLYLLGMIKSNIFSKPNPQLHLMNDLHYKIRMLHGRSLSHFNDRLNDFGNLTGEHLQSEIKLYKMENPTDDYFGIPLYD